MDGRLLFKDCTLLHADGRLEPGMALCAVGRHISAVGDDADFPLLPGDWAVDCGGRALAPGLIDCHTALPVEPHLLDLATLERLAAHALAEGLLRGVTTRVLQLPGPDPLPRLEAVSRAASLVGARTLLTVAPGEADGPDAALAQLSAVSDLAQRLADHPQQRAVSGWRGRAPRDPDFHAQVHAALIATGGAAVLDRTDPRSPVAREGLEDPGTGDWLGLQALLVGSPGLEAEARGQRAAEDALRVVGPGHAAGGEEGGVDGLPMGLSAGVLESGLSRVAWRLLARARGIGLPESRVAQVVGDALVGAPAAWMSRRFDVSMGKLEPGAAADLVLYDWVPQTRGRQASALLGDRMDARVWWTVVDGRVVVREGALLGPDGGGLARAAAVAQARLAGAAA